MPAENERNFCAFLLAIMLSYFFTDRAIAADIHAVTSEYCDFTLSGALESGDAKKFYSQELLQAPRSASSSPLFGQRLCLNSPGGSILEGLRIFEGIWDSGIITVVAPGQRCESACALAFLGGSSFEGARGTRFQRRYLFPGAVLGFHAPGLILPNREIFSKEEIISAFDAAVSSSSIIMNMLGISQHGVSPINTYLAQMILSTPPSSMEYIDTMTEAAILDIDLVGYAVGPIGASELSQACDAGYLRVFGLKYMTASDADLFHAVSGPEQYKLAIQRLDAAAPWRQLNNPETSRRFFPSIGADSSHSSLGAFLGAVSGYPGDQGEYLLCGIRSERSVSNWLGQANSSRKFRDMMDLDYSFTIDFFSYLWHDDLRDIDSKDLADLGVNSFAGRLNFVGSAIMPMSFSLDIALTADNYYDADGQTETELLTSYGGPSFDCSGSLTPDETSICENSNLAAQDLLYFRLFQRLRTHIGADASRSWARSILQTRRSCVEDIMCIDAIQHNAINFITSKISNSELPEWFQP